MLYLRAEALKNSAHTYKLVKTAEEFKALITKKMTQITLPDLVKNEYD